MIENSPVYCLATTSHKVYQSIAKIQAHLYRNPDAEMQLALGDLYLSIDTYGKECLKFYRGPALSKYEMAVFMQWVEKRLEEIKQYLP